MHSQNWSNHLKELNSIAILSALAAVAVSVGALAQSPSFSGFTPGNLIVSRSVYSGTASSITVGQPLPPVCPATATGCGAATDNGAFPAIGSTNNVWNNTKVDGSFGITSPILLDQITPTGTLVSTLAVPTTLVTTSFSSKSELAVNLSPDARYVTFIAYPVAPNSLDVSASNTPGAVDPTNPVGTNSYRSVAQVDIKGAFQKTDTNSYSGSTGRAAIFANGLYYMAGNSNNGAGTPANIISTAGVQLAVPGQDPSTPAVEIGNFSVTQYTDPTTGKPYTADKAGKDNNFRGLTIFNNTLYVSKGSGANGFDTVYQVGNADSLPTAANAASAPIAILPGLPNLLARNAAAADFPFGIWFANASTLYVADEGDGTTANAATSTHAGLQKWTLVNGTWQRAYVLQNGLNLGQPYSVANYPTAFNPATDGLRNITGRVNGDGTVTVWAVTSTISASPEQGADPNKLVAITDVLANTTAAGAASEAFTTIRSAGYGEVLRGVSFTPGTIAPLYITTASPLPQGMAGAAYSQTLAASGGTPPYTWSVASGTLPAGLALSAAGAISGTPLLPGASTFSVTVTDSAATPLTATQSVSLTVAPSACLLSAGGQAFTAAGGSAAVNVTGGSACPAWSVIGAPSWITVSGAGTGTGNGAASFQAAANTGAARSATLIIAFNSYTVEQAAATGITTFTGAGTIAQVESAGTWKTTITLINTGATPAQARLSFFDNNGNLLTLPLNFPQSPSPTGPTLGPAIDRTVNPLSELVIESTGPDSQATQTGWAQLLTAGALSGSVILRQTSGSTAQEVQAPIDFRSDNAWYLPFDNTNGTATQVIIDSLAATPASIEIVIRDDAGNRIQTGSIFAFSTTLIPSMGHTTFDLATNYPATKNLRGTVEFDSVGTIGVLGLRSTPAGAFSAIASIAK